MSCTEKEQIVPKPEKGLAQKEDIPEKLEAVEKSDSGVNLIKDSSIERKPHLKETTCACFCSHSGVNQE